MKPTEAAQVEFIKGCLRNGEKRAEILAKFVNKWQKAGTRTFDRRLKVATAAIDDELAQINEQAGKHVAEEIQDRKLQMLTVAQRLDILTRIATGQIKLDKYMVADGVIETVEVTSDYNERKAAIAEINKMCGDYAPQKTDITTNGQSINPTTVFPGDEEEEK